MTVTTSLITGRTSSHTIKVCIVGTNCICTYVAFDICVCTRGIVYELFHTHLTKHHIICDRLPQLIIHFARKVSHHEWWWIHFTVSSDLDDYFSIISTKHRSCESDVSICTASACCLYTLKDIRLVSTISYLLLSLRYVYLIFMCIIVCERTSIMYHVIIRNKVIFCHS